jgi:hypothetical protein
MHLTCKHCNQCYPNDVIEYIVICQLRFCLHQRKHKYWLAHLLRCNKFVSQNALYYKKEEKTNLQQEPPTKLLKAGIPFYLKHGTHNNICCTSLMIRDTTLKVKF